MPFLIAQTFILLLVATVIGLVAGWLIWGGVGRGAATEQASHLASTNTELDGLRGELDTRNNDVARLRRKLKRAVEELESHASQLEVAEERLAGFVSAAETGEPMVVQDPALLEELESLRQQLADRAEAHAQVATSFDDLGAEHANLRDQIRFADARVAALEDELALAREHSAAVNDAAPDRDHLAALEHDLNEAQILIRDAAERVTYLERQALLWQNEADRLQSVIDENVAGELHRREEAEREVQRMLREHDTALASLRMESSSSRLRADAAAEHLARLQHEFRAVQDRSTAHVESTRAAMADLDRQLALTQATLNDANAQPVERLPAPLDPTGLLALPGMNQSMIDHLHELGVGSLTDISRWSPDDVERISAWLPENPDVITSNDWVAQAQALLAGGTAVATGGS